MTTTSPAILLTTVLAVAACAAEDTSASSPASAAASPDVVAIASPVDGAGLFPIANPPANDGSSKTDPGNVLSDPNAKPPSDGETGSDPSCQADSDCLAFNDPCNVAVCNAGVCASSPVAEGSLVPAKFQLRGDCRAKVCGVQGTTIMMADLDDSSDDNECTLDTCAADSSVHSLLAPGTACSNGTCAEDGLCHAAGETIWNAHIPLPGQDVRVDCVVVDASGAAVVTGRLHTGSFPYTVGFMAKVNSHGGAMWHREFGERVSGAVRPAVAGNDAIVAQFASAFSMGGGQTTNLVSVGATGSLLWQHGTVPGVFVSPAGLAVDANGLIQAAHTFQENSCADFGGGVTCEDGAVSYDSVGNYVGFDADAAMSMVCNTSAQFATGSLVSAVNSGNVLIVKLQLP